MKPLHFRLVLALFAAASFVTNYSSAQDVPVLAVTPVYPGFHLPTVSGTLRYSVSLSEGATLGYNGNNQTAYSTVVDGNLAYLSSSAAHPFSAVYSGGYQFGNSGEPSAPFQNLAISQVLHFKRVTFLVADSVNYLPRTPIGVLSGLPGLGDVGVVAPPGDYLDVSLQSDYAPQISNNLSGSASVSLTARTSVTGAVTYGIQRFIGDVNGIQNNTVGGSASLSHKLDERSTLSGSYFISRYTYPQFGNSFTSQGASVQYSRRLSKNLDGDVSAGPLVTSSSGAASTYSYNLAADLTYRARIAVFGIGFSRFTNAGSGVAEAVRSNSVNGTASRKLGEFTSASLSGGYSDSVALPSPFSTVGTFKSVYGAAQITRSLTRSISAYASYTIQHQLQNATTLAANPLTGIQQTIAAGITYSPRPITVNH